MLQLAVPLLQCTLSALNTNRKHSCSWLRLLTAERQAGSYVAAAFLVWL